MAISEGLDRGRHRHNLRAERYNWSMLVRLGKVCGWAGTGLALVTAFWGFSTWSAGNGKPLYLGLLAAVVVFLIGQALRYVLAGKPSDR